MGFPTNDGGLSIAAVVKWLLAIASLPSFVKAYQGIVERKTATSFGRSTGDSLEGERALRYGLANLAIAALLVAGAWAVWRFWQSNED
jgi:hypothetical protein